MKYESSRVYRHLNVTEDNLKRGAHSVKRYREEF